VFMLGSVFSVWSVGVGEGTCPTAIVSNGKACVLILFLTLSDSDFLFVPPR
jgi:hypothetical protein